MSAHTAQIIQDALALSTEERVNLVEELLISIHRTAPEREEQWVREAKDRLNAYVSGEIDAISAEDLFKEFRNR